MINQFIILNDELNRCDWYLLSIELQRMFVVFLLDTQNPIKMLSYANISCERETFKKVDIIQNKYISNNSIFIFILNFR